MAGRLGQVLYIAGCILGGLFALYGAACIISGGTDAVFGALALIVGVAAWGVGRAFRYVLSGY